MNTSNITNYKPKDFAELLGISVKTLQRWDREGILKANRTPTDRRYYTYDQYLQFKGINIENDKRQAVIYARVSTKNQKDDLQNQVAFLRQFCNARGIIVDQCIEEYGSGLNYNRKKWNKLLDEVMEQKVKTIIITHKDRFIRHIKSTLGFVVKEDSDYMLSLKSLTIHTDTDILIDYDRNNSKFGYTANDIKVMSPIYLFASKFDRYVNCNNVQRKTTDFKDLQTLLLLIERTNGFDELENHLFALNYDQRAEDALNDIITSMI